MSFFPFLSAGRPPSPQASRLKPSPQHPVISYLLFYPHGSASSHPHLRSSAQASSSLLWMTSTACLTGGPASNFVLSLPSKSFSIFFNWLIFFKNMSHLLFLCSKTWMEWRGQQNEVQTHPNSPPSAHYPPPFLSSIDPWTFAPTCSVLGCTKCFHTSVLWHEFAFVGINSYQNLIHLLKSSTKFLLLLGHF